MKILIFWDIYWRVWRKAFLKEFKNLKQKYEADFCIACVDNLSSGRWAIEKHAVELEKAWVDLMTSWDHFFDNISKIRDYLNLENPKMIRPANYYDTEFYKIPGVGYKVLEKDGKKVLFVHLLSGSCMRDMVYNPFLKLQEIIDLHKDENIKNIIVDFHREFTAEIYWMAFCFDWKISFVYWTHTHLQTNDEMILDNGTWVIWDVWMSWSQFSVIWATLESVQRRFFSGLNKWKIEQSLDERYVVNGIFVETDDNTWKTISLEKIRINSKL